MKIIERLELQEKKKSYSQLIQQMHPPVISRKKQVEREINIAKLKYSPKRNLMLSPSKTPANQIQLFSNSDSTTNIERDNSPALSMRTNVKIHKRKWKENSMIPKPKKKREGQVVDYLLEQRIK